MKYVESAFFSLFFVFLILVIPPTLEKYNNTQEQKEKAAKAKVDQDAGQKRMKDRFDSMLNLKGVK